MQDMLYSGAFLGLRHWTDLAGFHMRIALLFLPSSLWLHPEVNHDRLRSNHPKPRLAMAIWIIFATPFSWFFMPWINKRAVETRHRERVDIHPLATFFCICWYPFFPVKYEVSRSQYAFNGKDSQTPCVWERCSYVPPCGHHRCRGVRNCYGMSFERSHGFWSVSTLW